MMRIAFFTSALLFQLLSLSAQAISEPGSGFRFGSAFGTFREGDYFYVDVSSRDLVNYKVADIEQKLNVTGMLGFHNVYNIINSDNRAEVQQTTLWGIALETRTPFYEGRSVFSRIGAIMLSGASANAFDSSSLTGAQVSVGTDFAFQKTRQDNLFGKSIPTYFVQFSGFFGFPEAKELTTRPDYINGLSLAVGLHNHF